MRMNLNAGLFAQLASTLAKSPVLSQRAQLASTLAKSPVLAQQAQLASTLGKSPLLAQQAQLASTLAKSRLLAQQAQFGGLALAVNAAVKAQLAPVGLAAWPGQATRIAQLASTLATASSMELASIADVLSPTRLPLSRGQSDITGTTTGSMFSLGDAASWMERNQPLAIWLSTFFALLALIATV